MTQSIPQAGELYRHYKGNLYRVLCLCRHTETMEEMVVYRSETAPEKVWARPLAMWRESVTVDGTEVPRFALEK